MEHILENDKARVVIDSHAAEITSFIQKDGNVEYIWQADPKYWKNHGPVLFPQVGNTYNKTQVFKGKEYHMGNHGLARHAEFDLVDSGDDFVSLCFASNDDSLKQYPYEFKLVVTYRLKEKHLDIEYHIENNDDEDMPFGFGLHPAFNCPLKENETFEDYSIVFPSEETKGSIEKECIIDGELRLSRTLFGIFPTVIFKDVNSSYVVLKGPEHELKVTCANYPYLALWSPSDAPFVCIEPWYSHGDFGIVDKRFEDREGIITLEKGRSFFTSYSIEILK